MTFDFYYLKHAIQQGHWWLIPAILLAVGLCIAAAIGIPRLLKKPFLLPIPTWSWMILLPGGIRQMLVDFVYGSSTLLWLAALMIASLMVLMGIILASSAGLNLLAGQEMISLIGNPDENYTALMGLSGGILLAVGFLFTFFIRAAARGEYALLDFIFWASTLVGVLLSIGAVVLYYRLSQGFTINAWQLLLILFLPAVFVFILGFKALSKR